MAAALSELNARLRGIDAEKLRIDPPDPHVLRNAASLTMDTDNGPPRFLNDVPGSADYDQMLSRACRANAGQVTEWVVGYDDLIRMKEASGREQDLLDMSQLRQQRLSGNDRGVRGGLSFSHVTSLTPLGVSRAHG